MLVVGAKGFAKEVLEILFQLNDLENLVFFDNVSGGLPSKLYDRFDVIKNFEHVEIYFEKVSNEFTLGIGNPGLRKKMYDQFVSLGGVFRSTISPKACIGHFGNFIGAGCNIISGTIIDNGVTIGQGCLLNTNSIIGHDSIIGAFTEVCPGAVISGNCKVGSYSFIGSNATVLPKINVGSNVIVAAGAVVTEDVSSNAMVAGNPAMVKKNLPELEL